MTNTLYLCKMRLTANDPKFVAVIGRIVTVDGGYQFLPNVTSKKRSRKIWPSANACIPKWTERLGFLSLLECHELPVTVGTAGSFGPAEEAQRGQ